MDRNQPCLEKSLLTHLQTNGVGYDVLRYICLPDLLGKDSSSLLYIMGKNLARKLQPDSITEIVDYFSLFGWGQLTLVKEKRREVILELTSEVIAQRQKVNIAEIDYRLESGFLAESMEQIKNIACECTEEIKAKNTTVQFNVIYTK